MCTSCWAALAPLTGFSCPHCCAPCDVEGEDCLSCAKAPPPQEATVTWGDYEGGLRGAILALKHRSRDELAQPLAQRIAARISTEPWATEIDSVTSVPSHTFHRLRRGWPAAELLARSLSRIFALPYFDRLRRHGTGRQAGRTRAQRLRLPSSSFSARMAGTGEKILLVDDVTTTGSTLRRASRALLDSGAQAVFCAAMARTTDARRLV